MAGRNGYLYEVEQIIPGTQLRVLRHVGMGGMGTVYEVQELSAGRIFVAKVLHPHLVRDANLCERLRGEAKVLASFDHENVVQVLWTGTTADTPPIPFYVMERLRGRSLSRVMTRLRARNERVALDRAFAIMECLLSALDYAHARGVIHRDVKTENVFLHQTNRGELCVKLLDFGIARTVGAPLGRAEGFVGTLGAAAPEQLRGEEPSPACDVYAAAIVFYELLTGRTPFDDLDDPKSVVAAHLLKRPDPVSKWRDIPDELDRGILGMLHKEPSMRPTPLAAIELIRAVRARLPASMMPGPASFASIPAGGSS